MLSELHVSSLGVIEDVTVDFPSGMTALTGETGAGKTLVVEALELLVGGRADPVLVRTGARRALVEGRISMAPDSAGALPASTAEFLDTLDAGEDLVISREIPSTGRSRAWVSGCLATASMLSELGSILVDLHGQHDHQALLRPAGQRGALDAFGGVDLGPLRDARAALSATEAALCAIGGDPGERLRQADFLRFQIDEIEGATVDDPTEDDALDVLEDELAEAVAHRAAAAEALACLAGQGDVAGMPAAAARDAVGRAVALLTGRRPFAGVAERLAGVAAEVDELARELRLAAEAVRDDPEQLAAVRSRRQLLADLTRKYGGSLEHVRAHLTNARAALSEIEDHDATAERLAGQRSADAARLSGAEVAVRTERSAAAPRLAQAVQERLRTLAMPHATFGVEVGGEGAGDDVRFLLGANPGVPALPLAKIASGGELARAMLAARLVTVGGPRTLVFDEVDAGIGGEAAVAVGRALAELAHHYQVIVVTHLAQVAAFADHQIVVTKVHARGATAASVAPVEGRERVVELSRMLSGQPASETARRHAEELLDDAHNWRVSVRGIPSRRSTRPSPSRARRSR